MSRTATKEAPQAVKVPVEPGRWRERVLDGVLRGVFVFWLILITSGVSQTMRLGPSQTPLLPPTVTLIAYLLVAAGLGFVAFYRRLHAGLRAGVILLTLYSLAVVELLQYGLGGDGRILLLTFIALATILLNTQQSLLALLISLLTLIGTAVAFLNGWLVNPLDPQANATQITSWLAYGSIFLSLGMTLAYAITQLIRSLDQSLADSQRERNLASTILDTSGALVILYDWEGRIVRFNRACEQITGYTFAEVNGKFAWDIFLTPEGAILTKAVFDQLKSGHSPSSYEGYWLTRQEDKRLIAWSCSILTHEAGAVEHIIGTGVDITAHKQAELERERLLTAEREQRLQAETLTGVSLSLTSQTNPTAVLDEILYQARRLVPYKAAHIALLEGDRLRIVRHQGYELYNSQELIHNFAQPVSTFTLDAEAVRTGKPIVVVDTRLEPRWITIEATRWIRAHVVVPIRSQDRVLGLLRLDGDTPREFSTQDADRLLPLANAAAVALENARLHQQTERQARRVQQILDTVQEGILLLDGRHRIELANPAAQTYLNTLAGAKVGDVLNNLGDRPLPSLLEPVEPGAPWHEIAYGKTRRIFEIASHRVEGAAAETGSWVVVLREVTEARKQQQFIQTQERLAMVGQLAAGIAHDFNNIMTVIILYSQMLLKSATSPGDQRVATIFQQAKLAASLITQILDFSRQSAVERRTVNLLPFLKEFVKLAKRTFPENIAIHLDYGEGDYTTSANLTRLQQVIMNLAVNARDAMPEGGKLRIELEPMAVTAGEKPPLPDMSAGEWLALSVVDTGTGIKPEDLARIFEPFFTTKAPGKGTGLGLAQVYGIIKQHDGFIDVTSELGKGTKFSIYLPAMTYEETAVPEFPTEEVMVSGKGQTILVVEDDPIMREAVGAILETLNYRILMAADGESALELFEQQNGKVSLVVSDMVMPGMSGVTLYHRLKERRPDIKMIIITGYPYEERDQVALSEGVVAWVQKPFEVEQIASIIQMGLAKSLHQVGS